VRRAVNPRSVVSSVRPMAAIAAAVLPRETSLAVDRKAVQRRVAAVRDVRPDPVRRDPVLHRPTCKRRPEDNTPRGGSGSGAPRRFVPWC
jgi:hypothetical protein